MMRQFEDLWKTAAGDGALSPMGAVRPEIESEALMDAWFRERQDNIESQLRLNEASRLLRELMDLELIPEWLRGRTECLLWATQAGDEPGQELSDDED
jgi:hypothetical protein